jgi:hypothetical protein
VLVAGLCLAVIVGGLLAYRRYRAKQNSYAHIETSAEISFLGQQDNFWIVELRVILNNKGKAQHKIHKFRFDLNAIGADDPIDASKKGGGRVNFGNEIAKGSFVPRGYAYCVIGPAVTATYTYVARVPEWATFLMLHCRFDYNPGFSHWMEKAVQVPRSTALLDRRISRIPVFSQADRRAQMRPLTRLSPRNVGPNRANCEMRNRQAARRIRSATGSGLWPAGR